MEELRELKSRMEQERPARWEELPDLALYMDQIISYMPRQLIQFIMAKRCTKGSDARVASHRHCRAVMFHRHRAELMAFKQLAALSDTLLHEERRATRHLHFHHDGHHQQHGP